MLFIAIDCFRGARRIVLFTDFGLRGPYTGQVKALLQQMAPGVPAIDLFADASAVGLKNNGSASRPRRGRQS
jgi:hypothetical protein